MRGLRDDAMRRAGATLAGYGTIRARLYDLGSYPGARCAGAGAEDFVKGELYRLNDAAAAIRALDEYEGLDRSAPREGEFVREAVSVALDDGRGEQAWAYLYNRPVDEARRIVSGDYRLWVRRRKADVA